MDHQDESWRRTVKNKLKPFRDRLVHRLGGTLPVRGLTYDELVHLIYPSLPEGLRHDLDTAATGDLAQASTIRMMLGTIEHQVAPTTFSVQITDKDAVLCSVGGIELLCDPADAAVTPGLRSGRYEPHLTSVFERYCRPGMTVVDVGANLGYYSLLAAKLVGPSGRVIAIEPNSENCRLLLSSLRLGGVTNVELIPVACDRTMGWAYYSSHVGSNGGLIDDGDLLTHPGVVVPTFRLDDIVKTPVGFMKMDVEGAEGRVVGGATKLIEHNRPIITTELTREMLRRVSAASVADYLGYFESLGYAPTALEPSNGAETQYPSMAALLADWGGENNLRDVLLIPSRS
jgi:FkbM family methyltransferase